MKLTRQTQKKKSPTPQLVLQAFVLRQFSVSCLFKAAGVSPNDVTVHTTDLKKQEGHQCQVQVTPGRCENKSTAIRTAL